MRRRLGTSKADSFILHDIDHLLKVEFSLVKAADMINSAALNKTKKNRAAEAVRGGQTAEMIVYIKKDDGD